jgi:hypothetical protein
VIEAIDTGRSVSGGLADARAALAIVEQLYARSSLTPRSPAPAAS